jgi:hypothetical protein
MARFASHGAHVLGNSAAVDAAIDVAKQAPTAP